MGEAATAPAGPAGRHQRRLRNYLLDRHFQLKYSGYLVAVALVLSTVLGAILWQTSDEVIAQSRKNVEQGERVVALGREVVGESRKVSAVVQMNIVKDPVYSDNPALKEAFEADSRKQDQRLKEQQQKLESQATSLHEHSEALASFQQRMLWTLCGVLALLVIGVGLAGIVVTHKIAGPIFKMKRQLREVGEGKLRIPSPLRKGDELVDFFAAFESMVKDLRARQQGEIEKLELAIEKLEAQAKGDELKPLYELRDEMKAALEV